MNNGRKLTLFIVGGLVVAFLLIWGGVLLGLSPAFRDTLGNLLPSGVISDVEDYRLQQEIIDKLESNYYEPIDEETLQEGAIDGMVGSLDDPYTVYMDPEQWASYQKLIRSSYSGVGMSVRMIDGMVTVVSTFEGSPAAQAGIEPGDIIIEVDGLSTEGQTLVEVVAQMKGPEGTTVTLSVYRPPLSADSTTSTTLSVEGEEEVAGADEVAVGPSELPPGGETTEYTLTRETIELPVSESELLAADGKDVALISFFTFSIGSAAELREQVTNAIEEDEVDAIILDLRGNPGGIVSEAVDVTSLFIEEGVVVTIEGLHSPKEVYETTGGAYAEIPLYVLVDSFSASASEIVSGALQDHERATLIGETTFGKGLVQVATPLSNGGALKMTTAVYLTPNGRNINEVGIEPDIVAPDDPATTDVDEGVEAALDLITGTTSAAH